MKLANLPNILQLNSLAAVDETAKKKVEPQQQPVKIEEKAPAADNKIPENNGNFVPNGTHQIAPVALKSSKLRSTTQLVPQTAPVVLEEKPAYTEVKAPAQAAVIMELTPENLQQVWQEFAENRKRTKGSTTEEIALNRAVDLVDFTIQIALDNDPQMDAIQGMRYDLIGFLKSRFNAPRLEINPRVAPHEVQRLPYTPAEKFNYMAEKNPYLLQLKQALGLDVDF